MSTAWIAGGAVANAAVLLLPGVFLGWPCGDTALIVAAFLPLATLLYLGDSLAPASRFAGEASRASRHWSANEVLHTRLALATGAVLLLGFWGALGEDLSRDASAATLPAVRIAGAALLAGGVLLRWLAIRTLGQQFKTETVLVGKPQLVRSGIYRLVRHPSESGLLLIALGTALAFASVVATCLGLAGLLPLVLLRLRIEERELLKTFGSQYVAYRRTTPALFLSVASLRRGAGVSH